MPVESLSDIQIAQRACTMATLAKISTFEDTSNEAAVVLNDLYEDIVTDALTIYPWRFAIWDVELGPELAVAPLVGFKNAYALPAGPRPLQVRTIFINGLLVSKYTLKGKQIHFDAGTTQAPVLEAIWRINEVDWPPWFRLYVIARIAGFLAGSVTRNGDLANVLLAEAEKQLVRSRTRDSQQQTNQKLHLTKVRSTRLGGRPM